MALFKIYEGTRDELKSLSNIHEGYAYFTTDDNLFHVDVGGKRHTVAADCIVKVVDGEIVEIDVDSLLTTNDAVDFTTERFDVVLAVAAWEQVDQHFECQASIPGLMCGRDGNVPPIITYSTNKKEYSYITDDTSAEPGVGIKFCAYKKPEEEIRLIVVDNK